MNEYGTFYMSTVGVGIIYSRLSDKEISGTVTTTTTTATTTTAEQTTTTVTTTDKDNYSKVGTVTEVKGNDITVSFDDDTTVSINLDTIGYYESVSVDDTLTVEFDGNTDEVVSISSESTDTTTTPDVTTTPNDTTTDNDITTTTTVSGDSTTTKLLGDVNLDGEVNAVDLLLLKKHLLQMDEITDEQSLINANINSDDDITSVDLLLLKKHLLQMIDINEL
jgi:hypothetical protein